MQFSLALLSSVLLAGSTLAAPASERGLAGRMQRRGRTARGGSTNMIKDSKNAKTNFNAVTGNASDSVASSNWSGMVLTSPPEGETFNAVFALITVPTPSVPAGVASSDGSYAATAWVGIDGDTYQNAILQTGVDFFVDTSGDVAYYAWYEWFPDGSYDFTLDVSAGDVISMYVNATSSTTGVATIENLTSDQTVSINLTAPTDTAVLGGQNAEWIVEDFEESGGLFPFADFGTVGFSNCVAFTSESSEGISSAQIWNIENSSDQVLTDTTFIDDQTFEVSYVASST